jgi:hypothetical protein
MHAYMNTRSMGSLKSLRNGGSSSRLTMEKTQRVIPAHLTRGHAKFVRCSGSTSNSSSFNSSTSSSGQGDSVSSGRIIIDGPPRASQQQQQQQSPPVANTTTSSSSPSTSSTPTSSSSSGVAAAAQRQQQRQSHQRGPAPARASGGRLPNQADSLFNPSDRDDASNIGLAERVATKSVSDLDYLSVRGGVLHGACAFFCTHACKKIKQHANHLLTVCAHASNLSCRLLPHAACETQQQQQTQQELLAIQRDDGPKSLGFFGTRNMGVTHQKLVEILAYAMVSAVRVDLRGGRG